MAKELSLVLRLKNELQVGLAKAKATMGSFGAGTVAMGNLISAAVIGAGRKIVGFASTVLSAFAQSETATKELQASFRAYGEEVDVNTAKVAQYVAAIKEETGASGTALTARAAKLKMLGVETDQLGEALKATVALASVGMDEEAATRAVAQAIEGNYTALSKYIPAVRSAATEQEKMAAVNDFVTKGYAIQKESLNTLAGQWGLLKERVGDAWEEIGAAIANNGTIQAALTTASEKARDFGDAINEWVTSGGIETFNAVFLNTMENIRYLFQMVKVEALIFWRTLTEDRFIKYFADLIASAVASAVTNFKYLGEYASAVMQKIKNPFSTFNPPNLAPVKAGFEVFFKSLSGMYLNDYDKWNEAISAKESAQIAHAARLDEIAKQQLAALDQVNKRRINAERVSATASAQIAVATGLKVVATAQRTNEAIELVGRTHEANEQAVADSIVEIHDGAAGEVEALWSGATDRLVEKQAAAIKGLGSSGIGEADKPKGGGFVQAATSSTGKRLYSPGQVTSAKVGGRVVPVYHNFDARTNDALQQVAKNTGAIAANINRALSWG